MAQMAALARIEQMATDRRKSMGAEQVTDTTVDADANRQIKAATRQAWALGD